MPEAGNSTLSFYEFCIYLFSLFHAFPHTPQLWHPFFDVYSEMSGLLIKKTLILWQKTKILVHRIKTKAAEKETVVISRTTASNRATRADNLDVRAV